MHSSNAHQVRLRQVNKPRIMNSRSSPLTRIRHIADCTRRNKYNSRLGVDQLVLEQMNEVVLS